MLANLVSNTTLGSDETCRNDNSRLAIIFQAEKQVLEETEINLHACLVFIWNIRNPCKETALVDVVLQVAVIVGEIQLERRIADNIVKLAQSAILFLVKRML